MSRSRRTLTALVGLVLTIASLIAGAPTALAQRPPDPAGYQENIVAPPLPQMEQVSYGSPIWVFILVAAVAAALTVAAMLALPKLWHLQHPQASHA
jgi:hypothetical protein